MRAVQVADGQVLVGDVPEPEPGDQQAVVRITTAGVCHSDLHLARGDWSFPWTGGLGHEAIGVVEALGPGADRYVQVGDRVILGLGGVGGGPWCGACEVCLRGLPRLCAQSTGGIMGTFAERFAAFAPGLVVLPDVIADDEAPLACGGLTAYSAVRKLGRYGVAPGSWLAVLGAAGGLGHYAVQIASALGYRVLGVDVGADRLEFVESLGAERAVEPADAPAAALEVGGVAASLVFAARIDAFQMGLDLLRPAGLFVGVGLPPSSQGHIQLNPFLLMLRDPTIVFSTVGNVQEMRELVELAARGVVHTHVSRRGPLDDLPAIFDELEAGTYLGRALITDLAG